MKNNKGITLIVVIITVILLGILATLLVSGGIDTFENSKVAKFEMYMKMLQKKVDNILEEGTDYMTLGQPLTNSAKAKLRFNSK